MHQSLGMLYFISAGKKLRSDSTFYNILNAQRPARNEMLLLELHIP